ncbi:MAG: hypothetical protein HIU92_13540 [Proteobacteria bacterium]|nr:hypothetical protein [Pseudomonadota bacterium]
MADNDKVNAAPDQHGQARHLADKAREAAEAGDHERAAALSAQARHADAEALATARQERDEGPVDPDDVKPASDEEVAAITRTVRPHSSAPSRAGIVGPGSGADGEGVGAGGPTQKY